MKRQTKLSSAQQEQAATVEHSSTSSGQEFATPEALLRFDAAQTTVPSAIAARLSQSAQGLPPPKISWWKRWFGGAS